MMTTNPPRTISGSPSPGPAESLVGSSRRQMRYAAAKRIATEPDHPLKFLIDEKGKFKSQRGLKHHELIERPDIIQMGHMVSNKLGHIEYLMLQGAWENQLSNLTIEGPHIGGAVLEQTAIDIGGIAVDKRTARFWEEIGWLKPGTVETAPVVVID